MRFEKTTITVNVSSAIDEIRAFKQRCIDVGHEEPRFAFDWIVPIPSVFKNEHFDETEMEYGLIILNRGDLIKRDVPKTLEDMLELCEWAKARSIRTADALRTEILTHCPLCIGLARKAIQAFTRTGHTNKDDWLESNWGCEFSSSNFQVLADLPEQYKFKCEASGFPAPIFRALARLFPRVNCDIEWQSGSWPMTRRALIRNGVFDMHPDHHDPREWPAQYFNFGACPECGNLGSLVNVGRAHWFVCDTHKKRWCAGSNLFSGWRREDEETWRSNAKRIAAYEEVEPYTGQEPFRFLRQLDDPDYALPSRQVATQSDGRPGQE